jgi:hypothetical protein
MRRFLSFSALAAVAVSTYLALFYWPALLTVTDGALERSVARSVDSPTGFSAISCDSESGHRSCFFLAGSILVTYDITMRDKRCWTGILASPLRVGFTPGVSGCVSIGDVFALWRIN